MDNNHSLWNARHKELRSALKDPADIHSAINLFLQQHAWVHDGTVSHSREKTFADTAWEGVSEAQARVIPNGGEHSFAWLVWHVARIEDVTMNVLVAGRQQVFISGGWQKRLRSPFTEIGNAMTPSQREELSTKVDVAALRDYRAAVGKQTREIVRALTPDDLMRNPSVEHLQRLLDEEAIAVNWQGPLEYWGGLVIAGLLLMPPTQHNLIHLNEVEKLKKTLGKQEC